MATKKQKRAAALAKRERMLAAEREIGLKALEKDRYERDRKNREAWQENHDKNHSWKKRIKECPHCKDLMDARAARERKQKKDVEEAFRAIDEKYGA